MTELYERVRRQTEALVEPLEVEDTVAQSMTFASPTKWHLGHTTWFFDQFILLTFSPGHKPFHPQFSFLFNSYYNAVGERVARPIRGLMTRPTLKEVVRYRERTDEAMTALLRRYDGPDRERLDYLVEVGCNHEQQHQELLLTDLKHLFSLNILKPQYKPLPPDEASPVDDPGDVAWIEVEGGVHSIGHGGAGFAYDNEGPRHRTYFDSFEIANRLTTNREFLAFIEDGGYRRPELWLDEGWAAVQDQDWNAPLYWEREDGEWKMFTLNGRLRDELGAEVDLDLFQHHAFFNEEESRIEMHLVSLADQAISLDGEEFTLERGETIHTENSYKYDTARFVEFAEYAGFRPKALWTDDNVLFSVQYFEGRE